MAESHLLPSPTAPRQSQGTSSRSKTRKMLLESMRELIADTTKASSLALVDNSRRKLDASATTSTAGHAASTVDSPARQAPTAVMVDVPGHKNDQHRTAGCAADFIYDPLVTTTMEFDMNAYAGPFDPPSQVEHDMEFGSMDFDSTPMDLHTIGFEDVDWTVFSSEKVAETMEPSTTVASATSEAVSVPSTQSQTSRTESATDNDASSGSPNPNKSEVTERFHRRASNQTRSSTSRSATHSKPYRAHSAIEKRYRAGIQEKFRTLRSVVAQWRQEELDSEADEWEDSSAKLNKSGVLAEAVECINQLKEENELLFEQFAAILRTVKELKERKPA